MAGDFCLDEILEKCFCFSLRSEITEEEVMWLCDEGRTCLLAEPSLLEIEAPVNVVGDLKGRIDALHALFELGGFPPNSKFLFLGNYVDIEPHGIECFSLLLALKLKYPRHVFLLRGNHECGQMTKVYGFLHEVNSRFTQQVCDKFIDCFDALPIAALVNHRIFCVHGGLSQELESFDQIRNMVRPTKLPESGLLVDLLWASPNKVKLGYTQLDCGGVSHSFGADVVCDFVEKFGLDMVVRSLQVVTEGFEYFADKKLVSVYPSPNYKTCLLNLAALMKIDESLNHSFVQFA
eukprot:c6549_g1_i1.p1 GENE.c6549_g1_i1~~c6549_g1_i1.p1  ORF type:complete len:292 (+),score=59.89 c6549_g1_i1:79-954(+)